MNRCPAYSPSKVNIIDFPNITTSQVPSSTTQQVAECGLALSSNSARQLEFIDEKETQIKERGYTENMPKAGAMIERLPKSLQGSLRDYIGCEDVDFEMKNHSQPKIASPKKELMEKILKHYRDKYKIEIELCEETHLQERLKSLESSGKEEIMGIIVSSKRCGFNRGHVIPLLCHFIPAQNSEAVILDVASRQVIEPLRAVVQACLEGQEMTTYISALPRQVDIFSCRTDAMCILRNALLHIQLRKKQNCFEKIADF